MTHGGANLTVEEILGQHTRDRAQLIQILQEVQQAAGYVSRDAMVAIGRHLKLPPSKVHGVATFYNQFRFHAPGRYHIQVCRGTACHVKGSAAVLDALQRELRIEPGQNTRDGLFSLEVVSCIGACGLAPVIAVNGKFFAGVEREQVAKIIRRYRKEAEEVPRAVAEDSKSTVSGLVSESIHRTKLIEHIKRGAQEAETLGSSENDTIQRFLRREVERPTVYVGCGTCGLGAGAEQVVEAVRKVAEEQAVGLELVRVGCVGLCAEEPIVDVQLPGRRRVSFGRVDPGQLMEWLPEMLRGNLPSARILGQSRDQGTKPWEGIVHLDEHPFFAHQTRVVLERCGVVDPDSIEEAVARGAYRGLAKVLTRYTPAETCNLVEKSGLRGRGGAGFPAGRKWQLALATPADERIFICNADEGDPGAFMDRAVIEGDPHRVLEGLAIGAYAIGASKAFVYIRAEYPLAIERLNRAIESAKACGLLGENILDSGFSLDVKVKRGAGAFVCGEETALIQSMEGRRGMPRPRPPYPASRGLFDKPTVINNVETLANLSSIMERGFEWFSGLGTATSKGTKVFALSGKVQQTGLVEVAMGTTLRQIVFDVGGGPEAGRTLKAVQIGGPSGGCVPESHLDIQVDYESLKQVGAMMGSGGLVVMDDQTCMVDVAKFFMSFIQRESCGKCIPCREGTRRVLEILERISRSRRSEKGLDALERFKGVTQLEALADVIRDTSLCGLGQSAANPVLSTLRWFRDEYEAHVFERKCVAGVCKELLTYTIDVESCSGCGVCVKRCPAEAILGTKLAPHYILPDRCIACGACMDACRIGAVKAA